MGLWPRRNLSCAPTWLGFPPSQTFSVSKDINKKQGRMFGGADSGAMAETRNKISIKHRFSFASLGADTYKICVSFREDKATGA